MINTSDVFYYIICGGDRTILTLMVDDDGKVQQKRSVHLSQLRVGRSRIECKGKKVETLPTGCPTRLTASHFYESIDRHFNITPNRHFVPQ